MNALVYGIGNKGIKYLSCVGGKRLKEYRLWCGMLERCTNRFQDEYPTYIGVSCSENFKSYSFFYEWCNNQIGFGNIDDNGKSWHLDKDLLVKGNKLYSESVCVFVPHRINSLLTKSNSSRGEWPVGVHLNKMAKKFAASCNNGTHKRKYLGLFNTAQEAFLVYKPFKEALIKEVADKYKEALDVRVYDALMNYEVNIND